MSSRVILGASILGTVQNNGVNNSSDKTTSSSSISSSSNKNNEEQQPVLVPFKDDDRVILLGIQGSAVAGRKTKQQHHQKDTHSKKEMSSSLEQRDDISSYSCSTTTQDLETFLRLHQYPSSYMSKESLEHARELFYKQELFTFDNHETKKNNELQENLLGFFFYFCIVTWYIQIIIKGDV